MNHKIYAVLYEQSQEQLAKSIAMKYTCELHKVFIQKYPNGEFFVNYPRITNKEVLVIFPKLKNIHEHMFEFITMLGLCNSVQNINALIPYIPYSRQDKSINFHNILKLFKTFNLNKIYTFDIHNDSNLPKNIINILPHQLFGERFSKIRNLVVVAPDTGSINRAYAFSKYLNCEIIYIDKKSGTCKNIEAAHNKHCLIVDDIIDTGKTIDNAYKHIMQLKPLSVLACITHIFSNFYIKQNPHIRFHGLLP